MSILCDKNASQHVMRIKQTYTVSVMSNYVVLLEGKLNIMLTGYTQGLFFCNFHKINSGVNN